MSIVVDDPTSPAQSPLSGQQSGLTVETIIQQMATSLGHSPDNGRFRSYVLRWINEILLDIQLCDPLMRRTTVHDAAFNLVGGTDTYDVRTAAPAGFGWGNCYSILRFAIPSLGSRMFEPITLDQYRSRNFLAADQGPPGEVVILDGFRVRFVPTPDQAYAGKGDYVQDIPQLATPTDRVDWPKAWDVILQLGVRYLGYQAFDSANVGSWLGAQRMYEARRDELKATELAAPEMPGRCITVRSRRHPGILHDNSRDIRWRG
jgi:hypothetical protein